MLNKEERQRRIFVRQELRKKNLVLFYKEFGVNHRAWLKELTEKYKERGIYPLSPLILSDYYQNYGDKLLSTLIACFLLDDNSRTMQQVLAMKKLLGEHPYKDLYSNRTFVQLSNGENQTKCISYFGSVRYWQVAKLLDIVWNIEHTHNKPLFDVFFELIAISGYTPYHALSLLFEDLPVSNPEWRINLALLRLCSGDGIGECLWDLGGLKQRLKSPLNKDVKQFISTWLPKYNYSFTLTEVCFMLGFESETDLYYCMLAFKELSLYKAKEVKEYIHLYSVHYKRRQLGWLNMYRLKNKIPTIEFGM